MNIEMNQNHFLKINHQKDLVKQQILKKPKNISLKEKQKKILIIQNKLIHNLIKTSHFQNIVII